MKESDPAQLPAPGEAETTASAHAALPRRYRLHDFRQPRALSAAEARVLESIFVKFARAVSTGLSALARARVQVDLVALCQKPYSDVLRSLPNPTSLYLVYQLPERLPFVLEIGPSMLYPLIERLLGGRGQSPAPCHRPPTRIEQSLGRSVTTQILRALEQVWASTRAGDGSNGTPPDAAATDRAPARLDLAETEHNPLLMQIVGPTEPTLMVSFQVGMAFAAGLSGQFHLCLPARPFAPLVDELVRAVFPRAQSDAQRQAERDRILAEIEGAPVEVRAELADFGVAIEDLLALAPGDVLALDSNRDATAAVHVDGRNTLVAQPVTRHGRRALRVIRGSDNAPAPAGPGKN